MGDTETMKIAIGADHRGYPLKESIKRFLERKRYTISDYGTDSTESVDYPDIAIRVARTVARKSVRFGILVCLTGEGMTITANKVKGIRAALCTTPEIARLTRAHNDANVLVIPGYLEYGNTVRKIIQSFVKTPFARGRHSRRVNKIKQYERNHGRG